MDVTLVTLDLTISNAVNGTDTQIACDSYTWIDGNTYTASNNQQHLPLQVVQQMDATPL